MIQFYVALPATIDDIDDEILHLEDEQSEPILVFYAQDGVWVDLDAARNYYESSLRCVYKIREDQLYPWDQLSLNQQAFFTTCHALQIAGLQDQSWSPDQEDISDFLLDAISEPSGEEADDD